MPTTATAYLDSTAHLTFVHCCCVCLCLCCCCCCCCLCCCWWRQATSCGWLTLWDTRFLVPVLTWRHPLQRGVDALAIAPGPPGRLGLQLGASGARLRPGTGLVYIAAGQQEIGLWDLEQGACHQVGHQGLAGMGITSKAAYCLVTPYVMIQR
jgi:hypothetical protein